MINFEKYQIHTGGRTSGRMKAFCPKCHEQRKDKRDKSLSVNLDTGQAYCHYCNWKINVRWEERQKQEPTALVPVREVVLKDEHVEWFATQRGIPASVLIAAGVTSAEEFMPQTGRKEWCICFNYYEDSRLVNTKYRNLNKQFKLISGAELIPYNLNGILGEPECIITEGEIDALSFMTIGRTDVVSVPGGANSNLSWMDRFIDSHFSDKKVIYICTDTDRKGQQLRDELLRRLGAERCRIVDLQPAKDANEVLTDGAHGAEALKAALDNAPQAPLEGVYTAEDLSDELRALYENGLGSGADTGWENLDRICTFETGRICIVTGIPGSGKSEFVDELVLRLNLRHHWRVAFFSPENMPMAYHLQKLAEKLLGDRFNKHTVSEVKYRALTHYLQENVTSIFPKEDFTAANILAKARELVHRRGIRTFVLDPLNCIDHLIPRGESETQYLNGFLNNLVNFARRNQCLVILVAHPRKMPIDPNTQQTAVPDMYDISGSAAFYAKADYGLVVERNRPNNVTRIHVKKVKFKHLGDKGIATFVYNSLNGRFTECTELPGKMGAGSIEFKPQPFDNTSWLQEDVQAPALEF